MRNTSPAVPGFAVAVVGIGVVLAMILAVQPYFDAAYQVNVPVLTAGLTPYLIYGVLAVLVPDRTALGTGVAVLIVHGLVGLHQRFLTEGYMEGSLLWAVPLVLALVLIALAPWAHGSLGYPGAEHPGEPKDEGAGHGLQTHGESSKEIDRAA